MPVSAINISLRQPDLGRTDPNAWDEHDGVEGDPELDETLESPDDAFSSNGERSRRVAANTEADDVPTASY